FVCQSDYVIRCRNVTGVQTCALPIFTSVLLPIVFSVGPDMGMNPQQFLPLLAYAGYLALALPSANPITAFMHGQDQLVDTKQILKFSIPSVIVCLIIYAVVGIPLSQVFF